MSMGSEHPKASMKHRAQEGGIGVVKLDWVLQIEMFNEMKSIVFV